MNGKEREYLAAHRCHDFENLASRWRAVAQAAGLRMDVLAESDDFPVFAIESEAPSTRERGLYLSAGIHGDEAAAALGALEWAEKRIDFLAGYPVTIFPCLNPWGLVNNCRLDARGRDLNRIFDDGDANPVRQWRAFLAGRKFRLALCLHEDYDAQGAYVYELARGAGRKGAGDRFLAACEAIVPRQAGDGVEGRAAKAGVISPQEDIEEVLKEIEGMPEAISLYLEHTDLSLTFETPSEYSLVARVGAHVAVLDAAMELLSVDPLIR